MADGTVLATIIGLSIIPPLLFMVWIRNRETYEREPFFAVLGAFGYGATIGIIVAFILNTLFDVGALLFLGEAATMGGLLTAVVAAPLIEEATKGMGLGLQRRQMDQPGDGIVYGAAIGLGFAATENILYGITGLLDDGQFVGIFTVALRVFSSTILHAASSGLLGYGYSLMVQRGGAWRLLPMYLVAVALHAAYNLLVSLGVLYDNGGLVLASFALSIVMVWAVFVMLNKRVRNLDALHGWQNEHP